MARTPVEMAGLVTRVDGYQPAAVARAQTIGLPSRGERPPSRKIKLLSIGSAQRSVDSDHAPGTPFQVGVARDVPETSDSTSMSRALKWQPGRRGTAAAISFTSQGAAGVRVGMIVRKLPAGAVVRGYPEGADTAFEISGATILTAIDRNRDAGDLSDAGRTYWTPVVESEELTLEIALPVGVSVDAVDVSVPRLSHLQVRISKLEETKVGLAASCEVDVSCVSGVDNAARSTARMIFTDRGLTYACTGTLLNDAASSGTPYFLSANHCISNQTVASSLSTYWFYRSTSCNSGILNPDFQVLDSGAKLLYASESTDTSFMQLIGAPPVGAGYSGWMVSGASAGDDVIGIHHPRADMQKYDRGTVSTFGTCTPNGLDSFQCVPASQTTAGFLNSKLTVGTTEPGSSGSGLFAVVNGSPFLVAQLYGGSASCSNQAGSNWYGRLQIAYYAALNRWLGASGPPAVARTPVYRFYNASTGAHFFTQSTAERDSVIAGNPSYRYEGVALYAYGSQISGSSPVYRLYNTRTGMHFYTISAAERDNVLATDNSYSYEGVSWYAQGASGGTGTAVYRFYNSVKGTHFYTISAAEKDGLVQSNPSYRLEGVAYYAWTTQ
jgi:lysyl endopeptidase